VDVQTVQLRVRRLRDFSDPVFSALERRGDLPSSMASDLVAACGVRNVLTHLYDIIDLDRVIAAVEPAPDLYGAFFTTGVGPC